LEQHTLNGLPSGLRRVAGTASFHEGSDILGEEVTVFDEIRESGPAKVAGLRYFLQLRWFYCKGQQPNLWNRFSKLRLMPEKP
jgi:hypothetical protein